MGQLIKSEFPDEFLRRLERQEYIDKVSLLRSLEEAAPVSIRLNTYKWNKVPAEAEQVPWCENGYYLKFRPLFTADPVFHSGSYYPQEASGMFMGEIFNQVMKAGPGLRVLDLCGAPGSKSTHLSGLIGESGVLVTNEVIRSRAYILAGNMTKWGIANTVVTNNDPSAFSGLEAFFDLIVVDAPCSGEGMFREIHARNEWSVANTSLCTERQRRILSDVWPALKSGGVLIYSTCTFNPAENEENVHWLINTTDSESLKIDTGRFGRIEEIIYKGIRGYGFHPGKIRGDGFFIAAVRKREGIRMSGSRHMKSSISVSSSDRRIAENLINGSLDNIYRHRDNIYLIHMPLSEYFSLSKFLRVIKGGTLLARIRQADFSPEHDLAMSVLYRKGTFQDIDIDYSTALSYLRRDDIKLDNHDKGWILLKYSGVNLGFVKSIGGRLNNYYPVDRRIRIAVKPEEAKLIKWKELHK